MGKTSSMKCWRITDSVGRCSKTCPGGNCWVEKPWFAFKPAHMTRDNSLFCYTVYAENKGKGIKNEKDLAILQTQLKNGVGLFACNDWEVFRQTSCTCPPAKPVRHWLLSILSVTSKAGSSASARSPASSMLRNEGLKYLLRFRGDCGSD